MNWKDIPIHIIDFEGNGRTGVVEFGVAILEGGEVVSGHTAFCRPQGSIPYREMELHGLTNKDVANADPLSAHWNFFNELRQAGPLGAHHASVEDNLLKKAWSHPRMAPDFSRPGEQLAEWGPWVDTRELYSNLFPTVSSCGLGKLVHQFELLSEVDELAVRFCPPSRQRFHAALYDAIASAVLLLNLSKYSELEECLTVPWLLAQSQSDPAKKQRIQQIKMF